ncbi:MAG: hypothetical protein HDQ98_06500 [Lachnospiraceae bacterium]|nr:hypothetical protein [Lachnospiraceae bacterium]
MTIALTAFKEKLLRKELYIISVIAILILVIFSSGTGTITVGGEPITGYKMLAPILLTVVNAFACVFAVITGLGTIPAEYERKTSHLIWIRNVPQYDYHGEMALANIMSGMCCEGILFCAMTVFIITNGKGGEAWRLIPAFLMVGVNVAAVSIIATALSIVFSKTVAGTVAAVYAVAGIFHELLLTLKDVIGGIGGDIVRFVLKLIPDLNDVQTQAGNMLIGKSVDLHTIFAVLLAAYAFSMLILFYKRKEA